MLNLSARLALRYVWQVRVFLGLENKHGRSIFLAIRARRACRARQKIRHRGHAKHLGT